MSGLPDTACPPSVLICGAGSGCGKTTLSLALMAAYTRRGLSVRPFKTGPDFIDPGWHGAVCGRPSLNLDPWMQSWKEYPGNAARQYLSHGQIGKTDRAAFSDSFQINVIEGAMGLYDGLPGKFSSAADVALELQIPLLPVIDVRGMSASAAAVARGLAGLRPGLRTAGAICVKAGSKRHQHLLHEAFAEFCPDIPLLGVIPFMEEISLPSRHLGLVQAADFQKNTQLEARFSRLADMAEEHINLDELLNRLIDLAPARPPQVQDFLPPPAGEKPRVRIALARDEAFSFWYPEYSLLLEEAGAQLVPFSPLRDAGLPPEIQGLILPGGYPELHARRLAENISMREAIRAFARNHPVHGECGGFLYLMEELEKEGQHFPMCGCLPLRARMETRRSALGYREVHGLNGPWNGLTLRGHEFHYSRIVEKADALPPLWEMRAPASPEAGPEYEGAVLGSVSGSYVHLSPLSHPDAAGRLVAGCLTRNKDHS